MFISNAINNAEIDKILKASEQALRQIKAWFGEVVQITPHIF
jgi:hypothetical protein